MHNNGEVQNLTTIPHPQATTITKDNYLQILSHIDRWEVKGQSYITVAHAYLGNLAYHIYRQGFWREEFGSWKEFCIKALNRPYPTVTAAYNNYKYYIIDKGLTLEEYLEVLSKIGVVSCGRLKTRKLGSKEELFTLVDKIQSKEIQIQSLDKEENNPYSFISFRIEKDKWNKIEEALSLVEKQVQFNLKKSTHIGERLYNLSTYLYGVLE